jgi:hypothetical protein
MTRHGTLAYYLAAWIVGCPTVALCHWLILVAHRESGDSFDLFLYCFFALMFGAADALLFALVLRRMMHWAKARSPLIWALAGATLALVLMLTLSSLSVGMLNFVIKGPGLFFFAAPLVLRKSGWWQAPIEGAAISAVLSLIDRAFNPAASGDAAEPSSGPAAAPTIPT